MWKLQDMWPNQHRITSLYNYCEWQILKVEISIHSDLIISLSAQTNIGVECWSLIWSLLSNHSNLKVAGADYNYVMLQTYHIGHWWQNQNAGRFTDRQRACVCASTKLILIYFCHFLRMFMRRNHNHQQFHHIFPSEFLANYTQHIPSWFPYQLMLCTQIEFYTNYYTKCYDMFLFLN